MVKRRKGLLRLILGDNSIHRRVEGVVVKIVRGALVIDGILEIYERKGRELHFLKRINVKWGYFNVSGITPGFERGIDCFRKSAPVTVHINSVLGKKVVLTIDHNEIRGTWYNAWELHTVFNS